MALNAIASSNPEELAINARRRALFWSAAFALGFLRVWAHRYDVNPDGLEYIEIAWASTHIGLRAFVNGYWSPLYPFLLSLLFRIFRPGLLTESTYVQLLNLVIYLANLACFEVFLRELIRARAPVLVSEELAISDRWPIPSETLVSLGYVFFIWTSYVWLSPTLVTPDLCVAALAYLAMAFVLQIRQGRGTWRAYALLGAVLGLAYLAKAAMFPVAFFFLASTFLVAKPSESSWPRAALRTSLAAIIFLLIAAPLVLALSQEEHRLSFGESGRDNYAWYVNRVTPVYWQGGPAGMGVPVHPAGQLLDNPPLFEFATPIPGSYPPGYEPSYWAEGIQPHFEFHAQLRALLRGLNFYFQMFSRTGVLYVVFLALAWALRKGGKWTGGTASRWTTWLPAYAALALYALVHVEPRFVGEFALMLLMALLAAVQVPLTRRLSRLFCLATALLLAPAISIAVSAGFDVAALRSHPGQDDFRLARSLEVVESGDMGVPHSEAAATIGVGPSFYWAHLASVHVVAEIPKGCSYWNAAPAIQAEALAEFASAGAKTVIATAAKCVPKPPTRGWKQVPGTDYFVHRMGN